MIIQSKNVYVSGVFAACQIEVCDGKIVQIFPYGTKEVDDDYIISGDLIYCKSAVERYGWIGATYEDTEITVKEDLVSIGSIGLEFMEPWGTKVHWTLKQWNGYTKVDT